MKACSTVLKKCASAHAWPPAVPLGHQRMPGPMQGGRREDAATACHLPSPAPVCAHQHMWLAEALFYEAAWRHMEVCSWSAELATDDLTMTGLIL